MTTKFYRSIAIWMVGMGALALGVGLFVRGTQRAVGRLETLELVPLAAKADAVGDLDEARALYERILGYTPDSRVGLLGAARTAYQQGRFTEALAYCDTALAVGPSDPAFDEHLLRGNLLLALGRPTDAAAAYRRAAEAKPVSPEPWWGLARTAEETLDFAAMRDALGAMAGLDSSSASRPYRERHERQRQTIEASAKLHQASDPTAESLYVLASALRESGKWDEAMTTYAKAAELPGCPADAWFWLGANAAANGDTAAARAHYERTLAAAPRHRAALRALK